jgi:hypothetical protein
VDDQGTTILDQEDGAPANLRTCFFHR